MVIHEVSASLQLHAVPSGMLTQLLHHLSLVSPEMLRLFLTLMQSFACVPINAALICTSTCTGNTGSGFANDVVYLQAGQAFK